MPRNNVNCDQCKKHIGDEKLAWFSDVEKDLDFCSESCYSRWTNDHNAQKWLESQEEYNTKEKRNKITNLNLTNCLQLTELHCYENQLMQLILPIKIANLKKLDCSDNLLTNLDFTALNGEMLAILNLGNNNFFEQDLSCLAKFTSLKELNFSNRINQETRN